MYSMEKNSTCVIDVSKEFTSTSPIFINKKSLQIVYPKINSPKSLSFQSGDELILQCLGGHLTKSNSSTGSTSEFSRCTRNGTISSSTSTPNQPLPLEQLGCSKTPEPTVRQFGSCNEGQAVEIGYKIGTEIFRRTVDLCYIGKLASTSWAHSKIPAIVGGVKSKDGASTSFAKGPFFTNVVIGQVYPQKNQLQTFINLFGGDNDTVEKYLPQNGPHKNYLVKGHLVARADLFYPAEQLSTYFYVNVLPMWQSVNNGNWKSVESIVRRTASRSSTDLDVWTGGLGILEYDSKPIYLSQNRKNSSQKLVPVPKLLFKLVMDLTSKRGLVFVTANDPHIVEGQPLPGDYRMCPMKELQVCEENRFKQLKQSFEGRTYCCSVDDFLAHEAVRRIGIPLDFKDQRVEILELF
ncbi:hypothetical protein QAD02_006532 [Eretmocerus hayati]|uniref:Uncharacterized protein n=1 Tax=Eretmocerus hayati TaxID=131215 RepID=A0ACC2N148_9HYME|nr:hypothetical protein QAD02_006532 [Eretmocerus hayati]